MLWTRRPGAPRDLCFAGGARRDRCLGSAANEPRRATRAFPSTLRVQPRYATPLRRWPTRPPAQQGSEARGARAIDVVGSALLSPCEWSLENQRSDASRSLAGRSSLVLACLRCLLLALSSIGRHVLKVVRGARDLRFGVREASMFYHASSTPKPQMLRDGMVSLCLLTKSVSPCSSITRIW